MIRFLRKLLRRRRLHEDLEAELALHRELSRAHENPIPLGNTGVIKEQALDLWRFNFVENLWRDTVYAFRGLRRNPALVASAMLSLGLGIGVNTAMFSLGIQFLFSTPSVRDPGSVVAIRLGGNSHITQRAVDFVSASGAFQDVVGENEEGFANYNDGAETHRAFAVYATKNFFPALGISMLYGRGIIPSDHDEVAVLQYRFWQRYFNGDPSIVGRQIKLDGRSCTVVGILPENHRTLLGFGYTPDLFLPRYLESTNLAVYARLKPGMTSHEGLAALKTVASRMDREMPGPFKYSDNIQFAPLAGYASVTGQKDLFMVGVFFVVLLAITGLVLLIACINVASLLLARGAARRGEIGIRIALGAGRRRLLQQLLAESFLLALAGAAVGFSLSGMTASLLSRIQLPLPLPIRLQIETDWRITAYAALLTTIAALACGLLPAWQSVRDSLTQDMHRERRFGLRRFLVSGQIAASVIVLTTGFVFLRSLVRASSISPGFDVSDTIRADVTLPPSAYDTPERKHEFARRTTEALAALPGVASAAAASLIPFNDNSRYLINVTFRDNGQSVRARYDWNAVSPDYFKTMGIPIVQGRTFPPGTSDTHTIIVNTAFVRHYFGGRYPVGTVLSLGDSPVRVVGVVEGTKTMTIGEEQKDQLYVPYDETRDSKLRMEFVVRSSIPPALQLATIRQLLHRIEPMAGDEVETMYSSIGLAFLPSQVGAILLGSIGALGLLLATIGLYGVMVYSVARRTREIGVRMAIGATRRDVSRMILRNSARLTLTGTAIGLILAVLVTRPLAVFLVPGLRTDDPLSLAGVCAVMILTGFIAVWGPMRRAIAIDPNRALREE